MFPDTNGAMRFLLSLVLVASSEAFFLKWGSDSTRVASAQKSWVQPMSPNLSPYRYQYSYSPYEPRKVYQLQAPVPEMQVQQSLAPIPISVPAGASLKPISLQHVQLVPCMCPVAPEEADKLQEQVGPGPYLAQTYTQPSYTVSQQITEPGGEEPQGVRVRVCPHDHRPRQPATAGHNASRLRN